MTVAEGSLPVGDTDENLATVKVTLDDGTVVHIEGVYVGDPEDKDARVKVRMADDNVYRLQVEAKRDVADLLRRQEILLERILDQLELLNS